MFLCEPRQSLSLMLHIDCFEQICFFYDHFKLVPTVEEIKKRKLKKPLKETSKFQLTDIRIDL